MRCSCPGRSLLLSLTELSGSVDTVPTRIAVQVACVVALGSVGTMLMLVGAYGSGALFLVGAVFWFWRLYRDAV